jgi:hypothetical protein
MLKLHADLESLAQGPTDERVRALERIIPLEVIQELLKETGHARRNYKVLPAWFVVWLVLGLGLFARDSYTQIFKNLQRFRRGATPRRGTITEARRGLGTAVMRRLAGKVIRLLGGPQTPGCFYKGMRLMGLDSFKLDLPVYADREVQRRADPKVQRAGSR